MLNIKKKKNQKNEIGFTLIELIVATFILSMVMVAMVSVSVAGFRSYQKSKAIKIVTEDIGYAVNSITKDVRMGKVESPNITYNAANPSSSLMIIRNKDQVKICYLLARETSSDYLAVNNNVSAAATNCPAYSPSTYKKIVDLQNTGMRFSALSGFRNQKTDTTAKIRGWAEINLNVDSATPGMETDSINVQTTVSSRDYGWEDI